MRGVGRVASLALLSLVVVLGPALAAAGAAPEAQLTGEEQLPLGANQGIARLPVGWILTGRFSIVRVDDGLVEQARATEPIPDRLFDRGYEHVGDPDAVGTDLYAPLEQPDYSIGQQVIARYTTDDLAFVESYRIPQNEASFVTVDPRTMIAYSMDHFGGKALQRYDVRRSFRRLAPLQMDRFVRRVQGADVARGAIWLSTDDGRNGVYRVDARSGHVETIGSTGHLDGEGEGIDATVLPSGSLHTLTVDASQPVVWLGHFALTATGDPGSVPSSAGLRDSDTLDSGWPPVLIGGVVVVAGSAAAASIVMMRRARAALRSPDGRP